MMKTLSISAFAVFLAGCATLPDPVTQPYQPAVPDAFQAGSQMTFDGPSEWWRAFGDPQLDAAIADAVGENPQVWQADALAAQSRASVTIARAARLPTASLGLVDSRRYSGGDNPRGLNGTQTYGVDLNVAWEIDLWGRLSAQSAAARERFLGDVATLRGVRQSIAAQTAKAYFGTVAARQQIDLSRRTLDLLTETARQVGNRADAGIGSPGDKFLAITNRETATSGLAASTETLERVTRQLETLRADYPSGTVVTASILTAVPPLANTGSPHALLARRPDIAAAENALRAAGYDAVAARRALLPGASLTGGPGILAPDLSDLLDSDLTFLSIIGSLTQPIFQGGRLRAGVESSEAAQRAALNAYAQTVRVALREVETALATRSAIARRIGALCRGAEAARAAEEIAFNRYRQGVDAFFSVSESQQQALTASGSCIAARQAGLDNHIDLMLALGGGFEDIPLTPTDPERGNLDIILGETRQIFTGE